MQGKRRASGKPKPRTGTLALSYGVSQKMEKLGLDMPTLTDVFRYGYAADHNIIVRHYKNSIVGIVIKADAGTKIDGEYQVITCWKWASS